VATAAKRCCIQAPAALTDPGSAAAVRASVLAAAIDQAQVAAANGTRLAVVPIDPTLAVAAAVQVG
jgi:hypothetical protein